MCIVWAVFTLDFWLKQVFHVVDEVTLLVKNNNKNNEFSGTFYKVNLGGSYMCSFWQITRLP